MVKFSCVCVFIPHGYTIHIHVYTSEDKKTVFMKPSLEKKNLLGILEVLVARLSPWLQADPGSNAENAK